MFTTHKSTVYRGSHLKVAEYSEQYAPLLTLAHPSQPNSTDMKENLPTIGTFTTDNATFITANANHSNKIHKFLIQVHLIRSTYLQFSSPCILPSTWATPFLPCFLLQLCASPPFISHPCSLSSTRHGFIHAQPVNSHPPWGALFLPLFVVLTPLLPHPFALVEAPLLLPVFVVLSADTTIGISLSYLLHTLSSYPSRQSPHLQEAILVLSNPLTEGLFHLFSSFSTFPSWKHYFVTPLLMRAHPVNFP